MASPALDAIIQMLKSRPASERLDAPETRASFELIAQMFPVAADVKREPASANGVPGEWITVPNSSDAVTIYYLHGGGYIIGSINTHADMVSRIARASGARAFSLNYRLAPEDPFPAAVEDATAAYRWLLAQGIRPESIVIAGDSAGGGLALATILSLKAAGDPLPGAAVLLSPWTDLDGTGESMKTRADARPDDPGPDPSRRWPRCTPATCRADRPARLAALRRLRRLPADADPRRRRRSPAR